MKNIFAMDISTEENGNSYGEADRFILRRVKEELAEQQDEMNEGIEEHKKNSELPVWLTIVRYICLFLFLVVVSATIKAGFADAMRNAPGLVIAGAFGGIVALVLYVIGKKKMKNVVESDDFNDDIAEIEKMVKESLEELCVPADAKKADVLSRPYKMKNGKEKRASDFFEYLNNEWHVFRDGDTLCLADCAAVIGIPVYSITGIYKVKKRINFICWNKEEAFNMGEYKQYKMTGNAGVIYAKAHYSMRFTEGGEEFEILFPEYELETFTRLTGAPVREESGE